MPKPPPRSLLDDFSKGAPYVTEARRLLRTLMRQQQDDGCRVLMVTSAARGEGKSTICALLSIVAARVFHVRTLLIDADLHRPSLHTLIDVAPRPGLFEYLRRNTPIEAVCRPTWLPTLHVIPNGGGGPEVDDAYDDALFAKLLDTLRPKYDMIFVDVGPVVPILEPVMIAEHVDGVLLVTMAGRTRITLIRRMKELLAPVSAKIAGVIINNSAEGLPYYYHYGYYGYSPREIRRPGDKIESPPRGGRPSAGPAPAPQTTKEQG
jgi:capsular exopolysaccharide synthesis family protein